jgi:hypothetical protein
MSTLKNDGLARLQRENDAIWRGKMATFAGNLLLRVLIQTRLVPGVG